MPFSFSFGKKKEKSPEVAAPVGKTPPAPPKVQNPPAAAGAPAVKPPQPSGLMPSNIATGSVATTQPMSVPRPASGGLRPSKTGTGQSTRSTQRIVLPTPPGARTDNTRSLGASLPAGKINLPAGMILRCLPPEVLSSDLADLERTGAAATEVGVPMSMILGQLPSGKVEMTLQELIPHIPPGFLQPVESLSSYMQSVVSLPLMDVVMRIPPDLLALRPDQKEVDSAVINMADPFTEEALREQAEAARRQAGTNIIDESQAPHEEFVPSVSARSVAPPRRPSVEPLNPARTAATTLAAPTIPTSRSTPPGLTPPRPLLPPSNPPLPPASTAPALPPSAARTPTGMIPTPVRMSAPLPPRQAPSSTLPFAQQPQAPLSILPAVALNAPVPPVPRNTGPIPAPPPPRHTSSLPSVSRRTGTLASLSQSLTGAAKAAALAAAASGATAAGLIIERAETKAPEPEAPTLAPEPTPEPEPVAEEGHLPETPAASKDDLQRLAALAMAQLGEADEPAQPETAAESTPDKPVPVTSFTPHNAESEPVTTLPGTAAIESEPISEAKDEPVAESVSEPEPAVEPEPETEPEATEAAPVEEPIRAPESAEPAPEPIRAPEPVSFESAPEPIRAPEPVRVASTPEPIRAPSPESASETTPEPGVDGSAAAVAFNLNTCTADDLLHHIPGVSAVLAAAIIANREKIGTYSKIEDLLKVPGMSREAYMGLTGEEPPTAKPQMSVNELLGFPAQQNVTLKDVTDRISCWPDVTGCLLSQSSGLSLVGTAPAGLEKEAVVAFAPRMFDTLNKSYSEITGEETDVLIIPSARTSFHLFRSKDLYLIIMTRLPLMPERHVKVARLVLTGLANRKE